MPTYRILGTSDDVTVCECCGRSDLKSTVVLAALDAGGVVAAETYYGSSCAAKAVGHPSR